MSNPEGSASEPRPRTALGAELIIPLIACGLTIYYLASTADLVWEARATGTVIGLVLLALCAAVFVRLGIRFFAGQATPGFGDLFRNDEFNRQRFGLAAMVMVYVLTIYWVGAAIGLFFLLIGGMWLLGVRSPKQLIIVALVAAMFVHLTLITLLGSKLPRGWIGDQFYPPLVSETPSKKK